MIQICMTNTKIIYAKKNKKITLFLMTKDYNFCTYNNDQKFKKLIKKLKNHKFCLKRKAEFSYNSFHNSPKNRPYFEKLSF